MRKILFYIAAMVLTLGLASCEKDEIGGTATQSVAGQWYVSYAAIAADGEVIDPDFNGGRSLLLTYNTSSNTSDSILINDLGNFLSFTTKANCNQSALTFSSKGAPSLATSKYVSGNVTISNGKILKGAGHQNNGSSADSIYFEVKFDKDYFATNYGVDHYVVSGVRYSGLEEND